MLKRDLIVEVDDSMTSISVEVQGRPLTAVSQRPESTNSGRKSQQSTSSARRPKTTGKIHHKLLWSLFHKTIFEISLALHHSLLTVMIFEVHVF